MNHVPKALKQISDAQLEKLRKAVNTPAFLAINEFARTCEDNVRDAFIKRRPVGGDVDYYDWGGLQMTIGVHALYKDLKSLVDLEVQNRELEKEEAKKKAT